MAELNLRRLDASAAGFDAALAALLQRSQRTDPGVEREVREIIEAVRDDGDRALLAYTRRFDRLEVETAAALEVAPARLHAARAQLAPEVLKALEHAATRIRAYHEHQLEGQRSWEYTEPDGSCYGQRVTPLDRVGMYVPGGRAAYPSTVLMSAIPARIAGVGELVMTVPAPHGVLNETVLAAAALAEVDRVLTVGGAQAIAALAFGTATVPRVDKIIGPGNIYVTTAKRFVYGAVGIDMVAGPTEIVVVCDGSADPHCAALDLCAQAEHDELAQAILVCTDDAVLDAVEAELRELAPRLERRAVVEAALSGQGALIRVDSLEQAATVVNRIAPEHLQLMMAETGALLREVRHAGAVFANRYSAEVFGDYCAGPSHVLPTAGSARFSSPLGVYDFQKRTSIVRCSRQGAAALARSAEVLARAEGLQAHARAAGYRSGPR